ncbi:MAG: Maf family nucleotide pyrophosphatase [Muribaculaceae bacterium]|nr:Maf family nucleotide pyrophosphatase [Muribaculaceae bacterium]
MGCDDKEVRRLVLASGSPRRRELLGMLGIPFTVELPAECDESYPEILPAEDVPEYLARKKAEAFVRDASGAYVAVTSDTVVILDHAVLGKPADEADARRMLHMLSGRTHKVVTGVCLTDGERYESARAVTEVEFAPLTAGEIAYYVSRSRPLDKAGAYGIQEWIGCIGVKRIDGSFYNVMGLPLHLLYTMLRAFSSATVMPVPVGDKSI